MISTIIFIIVILAATFLIGLMLWDILRALTNVESVYEEVMGKGVVYPLKVHRKYSWLERFAFSRTKMQIVETNVVFSLQVKHWLSDWITIETYPNYNPAAQDFSYLCAKHKEAINLMKKWPRIICTNGGYWT